MKNFAIKSINHVCLIVTNTEAAVAFYVDILGLNRHHKINSWFVLNETSTLHLIEIPEATATDSLFFEVQHFALEVEDLKRSYQALLEAGTSPFQMDFNGVEKALSDPEDKLDFGIGTVFVRDPDGNLVEFLEEGKGIFTKSMRPIVK